LTDERLIERINSLRVETPSWGYGNSGTRFKVFAQPGAARTIEEKFADAGVVNRLTRICPTVAIHIPWDRVDDWDALCAVAASHRLTIDEPTFWAIWMHSSTWSIARLRMAADGWARLPSMYSSS